MLYVTQTCFLVVLFIKSGNIISSVIIQTSLIKQNKLLGKLSSHTLTSESLNDAKINSLFFISLVYT